jgi:hypothetical protein
LGYSTLKMEMTSSFETSVDFQRTARIQGYIPGRAKGFSLLRDVQSGSGAHPTSYKKGTGGCFPGGKAAGAWSWLLTSI